MAVNKAALDLIMSAEGFVNHWYPDPAHGWAVPTCCYGHTDAAGAPKYVDTKSKSFTKSEGAAILLRDLEAYERDVLELVKVPINENQKGALTSFDYNLGRSNLAKSTLLKKLNKGDYEGAANEFGKWTRANGKVLPGLVTRRAAERALFLTPVSGQSAAVAAVLIAVGAAAYAFLKTHGLF
jgi:lysozyme